MSGGESKKYIKMGQAEVLEILKKNRKGMTAEEIVKQTNMEGRCVRRALMVMHKYNEVQRKPYTKSSRFKFIYILI